MFTIIIDTAGDAFAGDPRAEIARILTDIVDALDLYDPSDEHDVPLLDINGNLVGSAQYLLADETFASTTFDGGDDDELCDGDFGPADYGGAEY